jgi:predicted nucleic acid-binding protein
MSEDRLLLVDASVVITLARIDAFELLYTLDSRIIVPKSVEEEVNSEPANSTLQKAHRSRIETLSVFDDASFVDVDDGTRQTARAHLNADEDATNGDVALLTAALHATDHSEEKPVVVSEDKPLRQTCEALSITVSGSIGVLIRAVEQGAIDPDDAKDKLLAMDKVGARLSASLLRRAEALIDDAA